MINARYTLNYRMTLNTAFHILGRLLSKHLLEKYWLYYTKLLNLIIEWIKAANTIFHQTEMDINCGNNVIGDDCPHILLAASGVSKS